MLNWRKWHQIHRAIEGGNRPEYQQQNRNNRRTITDKVKIKKPKKSEKIPKKASTKQSQQKKKTIENLLILTSSSRKYLSKLREKLTAFLPQSISSVLGHLDTYISPRPWPVNRRPSSLHFGWFGLLCPRLEQNQTVWSMTSGIFPFDNLMMQQTAGQYRLPRKILNFGLLALLPGSVLEADQSRGAKSWCSHQFQMDYFWFSCRHWFW